MIGVLELLPNFGSLTTVIGLLLCDALVDVVNIAPPPPPPPLHHHALPTCIDNHYSSPSPLLPSDTATASTAKATATAPAPAELPEIDVSRILKPPQTNTVAKYEANQTCSYAENSPELLEKHLKATGGRWMTRFPPEPNGFLHLGELKQRCFVGENEKVIVVVIVVVDRVNFTPVSKPSKQLHVPVIAVITSPPATALILL